MIRIVVYRLINILLYWYNTTGWFPLKRKKNHRSLAIPVRGETHINIRYTLYLERQLVLNTPGTSSCNTGNPPSPIGQGTNIANSFWKRLSLFETSIKPAESSVQTVQFPTSCYNFHAILYITALEEYCAISVTEYIDRPRT
jgi:hypothetical protein